MRRGSLVGLLLVCLVASACGDAPGAPNAPSGPPAAIAPARLMLVSSGIELPEGGGTASIIVVTDNGGAPAPLVRVQLVASGGALEVAEVTTDATGRATVNWTGTETATITAAAGALEGAVVITVRLPVVVVPEPPKTPRPTPPGPQGPPAPPPPIPPIPAPPAPPPPVQGVVVTVIPEAPSVPAETSQTYTIAPTFLHAGEVVLTVSWLFEAGADATTTGPTRAYAYPTHGQKTIAVSIVTSEGRTATGTGRVVVTSSPLPPPPPPPPPAGQDVVVTVNPAAPSVPAETSQTYTIAPTFLHAGEVVLSVSWLFEAGAEATTTGPTRAYAYPTHGLKTITVSIVTSEGRTATGSGRVIVTSLLR